MTFRPCPTLCGRHVRSGHLMCGSCWAKVPGALRTEVHRTWRAWRRNFSDVDAMRAYETAADAAAAAAEVRS